MTKALETAAEAVYAEGMTVPDDKDDLEEEKETWVTRWENALVRAGAIRTDNEANRHAERAGGSPPESEGPRRGGTDFQPRR